MTDFQRHWWEQSRSDHAVFTLLRKEGVDSCHLLHYLQMATEKLSKAYRWREGRAPKAVHTSFVTFLKMLIDRSQSDRDAIAVRVGFSSAESFKSFIRASAPLAYAVERLAPSLAQDGPNPEYPWPHDGPSHTPASHDFNVWNQIERTASGRQFLTTIHGLIEAFPSYS